MYNPEHQPQDNFAFYDRIVCTDAKRTFSRFALALFLFVLIANAVVFAVEFIVIIIAGQEVAMEFFSDAIVSILIGTLPMYLISLPILYLMVRKMPIRKRERSKLKPSEFCALILVSQTIATVGNTIGTTLNSIIGTILGKEIDNSTIELILQSPPILVFAIVVVIGPLVEELIFRKLLIDRISKYGEILAIVVSSIAFGLFHGNFYQFFYAALVGLVLGYVYTKTGNWMYPFLIHMIFNFLGSFVPMMIMDSIIGVEDAMLILSEGGTIDFLQFYRDLAVYITYALVQYGMVIAGAAILIWAIGIKKITINNTREACIPQGQTFAVVAFNTGTILFLIISFILFGISIFV